MSIAYRVLFGAKAGIEVVVLGCDATKLMGAAFMVQFAIGKLVTVVVDVDAFGGKTIALLPDIDVVLIRGAWGDG